MESASILVTLIQTEDLAYTSSSLAQFTKSGIRRVKGDITMSKIKKVYSLIKSAEIEAQNIATEFSEASSNILYDFEEMEKLIEKCQELSSASSAKIIAAIREIPIISDIEKAKLTRRILHLGSLWEKSRDLIQPVVSIEP